MSRTYRGVVLAALLRVLQDNVAYDSNLTSREETAYQNLVRPSRRHICMLILCILGELHLGMYGVAWRGDIYS